MIGQLVTRFGTLPLRRFNMMLVEQLPTELIAKEHKNAYTNRALSILKTMCTKAVEWEMVEEDVLRRVRKAKMLREDKRLRYLTAKECQTLFSACDSHLKPIVITALNTGMRRRLDSPYVFFNPKTGLRYADIKHSFDTALKNAKREDFHFHDLRHTFSSHLIMAGVDLTTVKKLLGHKDIKMTLRYAHLAPSHKVKAVDILNATFASSSTSQKLHNLEVVK